jgi:hypothetical protein
VGQTEIDQWWKRIATDLKATVGKDLVLDVRLGTGEASDDDDREWCEFDVFVDGEWDGSYGTNLPTEREPFVVGLADYLDELVWGGWPICPDHNTHPLVPVLDNEGIAVWKCPIGRIVAKIGQLLTSP